MRQFDTLKVLRVISTVGDPNQLIGRTITGQSSNATAIVEKYQHFNWCINCNSISIKL